MKSMVNNYNSNMFELNGEECSKVRILKMGLYIQHLYDTQQITKKVFHDLMKIMLSIQMENLMERRLQPKVNVLSKKLVYRLSKYMEQSFV